MRFIDEAKIRVSAGNGGPGSVSFRREAHTPRGGPDGGDGGEGGDVIFRSTTALSTLQDFRYKREYKAENGHHGSGTNKAGRDGEDIVIEVPVGTVVRDTETGDTLFDFLEPGQDWVACEGGRGGKGNAHFVSSTFQAPKFAQPGEAGSFRELTLELKLLADAAIIGFPNAGKSTLISRVSAARPKIADYPFTTLVPNLGVVSMPEYRSFVIADIPGLIEGAHAGIGLGHRFLKHIERTRVFIHLLDGTKFLEDATAPGADSFDQAVSELARRYEVIRQELGLFNEELLTKPEIVALNKLDVLESDRALVDRGLAALRERIAKIRGVKPTPEEPYLISSATGHGVQPLLFAAQKEIEKARREALHQGLEGPKKLKLPDDRDIQR